MHKNTGSNSCVQQFDIFVNYVSYRKARATVIVLHNAVRCHMLVIVTCIKRSLPICVMRTLLK